MRVQIGVVLSPLPRGLVNLGQSCFMNASLQALLAVPAVRAQLAVIAQEIEPRSFSAAHVLATLASQLQGAGAAVEPQDFFDQLWPKESRRASRGETAAPTGALGGEGLRRETHCDPHEFILKLLDCVSTSESGAELHALFRGTELSTVYCSGCRQTKPDHMGAQPFTFLKLSIDTPEKRTSIEAALESYLKVEDMTGKNQYTCEACGGKRDATQQLELRSLPRVLMLQLERFRHDRTKIQEHVPFKETLMVMGYEYCLCSVVVHEGGQSANSGHYYTYARDGERWLKKNDANVNATVWETGCKADRSAQAYLLFYEQSSVGDAGIDKSDLCRVPDEQSASGGSATSSAADDAPDSKAGGTADPANASQFANVMAAVQARLTARPKELQGALADPFTTFVQKASPKPPQLTEEQRRSDEAPPQLVAFNNDCAALRCSEMGKLVHSIPATDDRKLAANVIARTLDGPHFKQHGVDWIPKGVNGNELRVDGKKALGFEGYGSVQGDGDVGSVQAKKAQRDGTLRVDRTTYQAMLKKRDQLRKQKCFTLHDIADDEEWRGAAFVFAFVLLMEEMQEEVGPDFELWDSHAIDSANPFAAFTWHVDDHAERDRSRGPFLEKSVVCQCSPGVSSMAVAGFGEVNYTGPGSFVEFPAWSYHRTSSRVETAQGSSSLWKLTGFFRRVLCPF